MIKRINEWLSITTSSFFNELRNIFNDAGALLIFCIALLLYPVVYALAYEKELVRDVPIAVVDLDKTASSRMLGRMTDATQEVNVVYKPSSMEEAKQLFFDGKINGVFLIPKDFEKNIYKGYQASVSIYCDASYFLFYKQVLSACTTSTSYFSAGVGVKRLMSQGKSYDQALSAVNPLQFQPKFLYNPSGAYGSFVMPGLLIVIIQQTLLIGIGMLGGTVKERKRHKFMIPSTNKRQKAIPVVLGHGLAFLLIYLFNTVIALLWIYNWFSYPDKSGFFKVFYLIIPFLTAVTFLGMTISVLFKKREHSFMFIVFLSPAILFVSGLSWPASAIPPIISHIAYVLPTTSMIPAYLRLRTMGVGLQDVSHEFWILIIQSCVYFVTACIAYKFAFYQSAKKIRAEDENEEED